MCKKYRLLCAVSFSLCIPASVAEAKLVRYEIDGQRYSYSTNNIQQVKEARQRIDAAKAAAAAKAQAEAERAANPFARIFGSPAQREAADAQARLTQNAATEKETDVASTSSVGSSRSRGRAAKRAKARIERRLALQEARLERRRKPKTERAQVVATRSVARPATSARGEGETPSAARPQTKPMAVSAPAVENLPAPRAPVMNSPSEPAPKDLGGGSLADFVNQVRKAPFGDAPRL